MVEARIIIDTRRKTDKGYPLKIRVYEKGGKTHRYISLGQYQARKQLEFDNFVFNKSKELAADLNHINRSGMTLARAVAYLKKGSEKEIAGESLFQVLREAIQKRVDSGSATQAFEAIFREIKNYTKDIPLDQVDWRWVSEFITFKRRSGTGEGGISYYVRTASTVWNEAYKMGLVKENPWRGHGIKRQRTSILELPTWEEIRKVKNYYPTNITQSNLENTLKMRDLFIFQILIGGHYISDVATLEVRKERFHFRRYKNRSKEMGGEVVSNMIHREAKIFLEFYGTDWIPHPDETYKFTKFRNNYNATLKRISKNLGIEPKLKSTTPRYLFRTAAGESRADELATMQLMGHKSQSISHGYQRKLPDEFIDGEHQKILEHILGSTL